MLSKIREYSKAIAALLGAIATFLVSVNAPASWSVYLGSAVAVLTGLATFGVSNKTPAAIPGDIAIDAVNTVIQEASAKLSEVDRVKQGVSDALGQVPVIGPLAKQVIDSIHL